MVALLPFISRIALILKFYICFDRNLISKVEVVGYTDISARSICPIEEEIILVVICRPVAASHGNRAIMRWHIARYILSYRSLSFMQRPRTEERRFCIHKISESKTAENKDKKTHHANEQPLHPRSRTLP